MLNRAASHSLKWNAQPAVEFALVFGIKVRERAAGEAGNADQIVCPSIDRVHMAFCRDFCKDRLAAGS
jgi:hypothetical protein